MSDRPIESPLAWRIFVHLTKLTVGGLVGLGILGWVVDRSGPQKGEAVVHVLEGGVTIELDGERRDIHAPYRAVVYEVEPGPHELRLLREGRPVFDETFDVGRGESVVLSAWDRQRVDARASADGRGLRRLRSRARRAIQMRESPGPTD